jgi:type IV fimbrial biogenesis protein FimT
MLVMPRQASGFSLIELLIAMTIAGILLALGAPAMSGYIQNARLGSMAQSIYSGLQLARTEAVKRNQSVQFVLTNSPLDTTAISAVSLDVSGRNWVVRALNPGPTYDPVQNKVTNSGDAGGVVVTSTAPLFTFNGLGGSDVGGTIALSNPVVGLCSPAGSVRCWNVVVGAGGQVRLCTPDASLLPSDTRYCGP